MLLRLVKTFAVKEVKEVMDAYPYDGDMSKKPSILFHQLVKKSNKIETGPGANSSCT